MAVSQMDSEKQIYRESPNAENMGRSCQPSDKDSRRGQRGKHRRVSGHMGRQVQTDGQRWPDSHPPCLQVPVPSPGICEKANGRGWKGSGADTGVLTVLSLTQIAREVLVSVTQPSADPDLLSLVLSQQGQGQRKGVEARA